MKRTLKRELKGTEIAEKGSGGFRRSSNSLCLTRLATEFCGDSGSGCPF